MTSVLQRFQSSLSGEIVQMTYVFPGRANCPSQRCLNTDIQWNMVDLVSCSSLTLRQETEIVRNVLEYVERQKQIEASGIRLEKIAAEKPELIRLKLFT